MNRAFQTFLSLVWALWLGGLVTLFIVLQSLFTTFADDRTTAGNAAAGIFAQFNRYQLALGLIALLTTFFWRLAGPSRAKMAAFILFAGAGLAAAYVAGILTPNIDKLRVAHLTDGAEFKRAHGLSMVIYLIETLCVLLGGVIVAWTRPGAARCDDH